MIHRWLQKLRKRLPPKWFLKPTRLDHGRMYMCVTVGLWLFALSLMIIGPTRSSSLSDLNILTQKAVGFVMFVGTTMKIHGFLSGTRVLMPKRDLRDSYLQALWAILATNIGLVIYIFSLFNAYGWKTLSTFGVIGATMVAGAIWNAWDFSNEIDRLNEAVGGTTLK
ncbi:membrane protein [Mycobacterium phage Indlulamithi]|uniref:Uncharacterized protein n=1 Tax=Mycobacterium phage Indlulamithi TaxID=2656582 RepID=A0A649VCY7_9CAUD|nr:membrane protein [Mycobacterium phage Indlulamithi]QGJ90074.1 hypothetical protein PBI_INDLULAMITHI_33 [Mycobacterium phage Indlulamithi]